MICPECNGILNVIRIEDYPKDVKDKLNYQRLCDVECLKCGKVFFSQPYDWGGKFNVTRKLNQ